MAQTEAQRAYNARRTAARRTAAPTKSHAEKVQERGEASALRAEIKQLVTERDEAIRLLSSITAIHPADQQVPKWMARKPAGKAHRATPVLMLSDLHLDEVVSLRDMHGMNEYSREIAERRLHRVIDFTVDYCRRYSSGVEYDGIVVALLGDIITGTIHAELAATNESPVPATIVHWVPILASALQYLADFFGHVHVPCVDGNHDRTTDKTRMKQRAENSYAWIVYNWLADSLRADDRITFSISPSSDQILKVYDTKLLLVHGDGFRGGGGVGGIYPSMLKYLHRQQGMWAAAGENWDYCLMGHWHSLMWGQNFIVNGSLKGYDEYARRNGFGFEKARQALFLVTPERGITTQTAVYADPA
jgi:predicted phosphodiesterase